MLCGHLDHLCHLCHLDVWDGDEVGRRSKGEGIYVYLKLIHFAVQQKLTEHCKAITFQLKIKKKCSRNEENINSPLENHSNNCYRQGPLMDVSGAKV